MISKSLLFFNQDEYIQEVLLKNMSKGYKIFNSRNFESSIQIIENNVLDLILIDIDFNLKDSFKLINYTNKKYTNISYILLTNHNINEYIEFSLKYNIYNILPKKSFLKTELIEIALKKILSKDIFGIDKYFSDVKKKVCNHDCECKEKNKLCFIKINNKIEYRKISEQILKYSYAYLKNYNVNQVLEELTSNIHIHLFGNKVIDSYRIGYGIVNEKFVIIVQDNSGLLDKNTILSHLKKNICMDDKNFPDCIEDFSGRGLYISREMSSQMIFNIKENEKTEIIAIFSKSPENFCKSLSIYSIK